MAYDTLKYIINLPALICSSHIRVVLSLDGGNPYRSMSPVPVVAMSNPLSNIPTIRVAPLDLVSHLTAGLPSRLNMIKCMYVNQNPSRYYYNSIT